MFHVEQCHVMYSRKIYATGTATANAAASITIPKASQLVGVQWSVKYDSITDNAACVLELSQASATEIAVNGSQQCISELSYFGNFVTSGLSNGQQNVFFPCNVQFTQGQLLYLHALVSGTISFQGGALLWLT